MCPDSSQKNSSNVPGLKNPHSSLVSPPPPPPEAAREAAALAAALVSASPGLIDDAKLKAKRMEDGGRMG